METLTVERPEQLDFENAEQKFAGLVEKSKHKSIEFFGSVAVSTVVDIEPVEEESFTLMESAQEALRGSQVGWERVRQNVVTDVAERLFKAGHQTTVRLNYRNGRLEQNGVPFIDVQKNTIKSMPLNPVMRKRTEYEARNAVLFENFYDQGVLDKYDLFVLSPTPVDERTRKAYNFFTYTDSLSVQYLKKTGEGELTMETAMVAGKRSPKSKRHDIPAVFRMLESAGYDTSAMDENDVIGSVVLVPRTKTSGVHNIVAAYDNYVGNDVFYGEEKPKQDYTKYREVCRKREGQFDELVDEITKRLIGESNNFRNPYDAIEKLDELSDELCLDHAVDNREINAMVFGSESAQHIEYARMAKEQNDIFALDMHMKFALQTSQSSSCPLGRQLSDRLNSLGFDENGEDKYGKQTKLEDCEFVSKQCPVCKESNAKTKVKNGKYYHVGKSCKA